ncbi:MAG: hypothetical protein M3010_03435 [Candidatus Dormibacteraeota bacterium]|nr:hypothetical protein [Candidatus Dormibacteraeota bacterium]
MGILIFITAITVLAFAVQRWGHDSRDGRDWQPRPDAWRLPQHHAARAAGVASTRLPTSSASASGAGSSCSAAA